MLCVSSKWHVYAMHAQLLAKKICMQKINNFNFSITILRKLATSAFFNFFRFVPSNLQFRIIFNVYYLPPASHIWQIPHKFWETSLSAWHWTAGQTTGIPIFSFLNRKQSFRFFSAYYRNKKQGFRFFILVKKTGNRGFNIVLFFYVWKTGNLSLLSSRSSYKMRRPYERFQLWSRLILFIVFNPKKCSQII